MVDKTRVSSRLRATLKIAQLVGFEYDASKAGSRYGGFFSTEQLEKIVDKLRKRK
jgi:hypothetical protein